MSHAELRSIKSCRGVHICLMLVVPKRTISRSHNFCWVLVALLSVSSRARSSCATVTVDDFGPPLLRARDVKVKLLAKGRTSFIAVSTMGAIKIPTSTRFRLDKDFGKTSPKISSSRVANPVSRTARSHSRLPSAMVWPIHKPQTSTKARLKKLFQIKRVANKDSGLRQSSSTLEPPFLRSSSSFSLGLRAKKATSAAEDIKQPARSKSNTAQMAAVPLASIAKKRSCGRGSGSKIRC